MMRQPHAFAFPMLLCMILLASCGTAASSVSRVTTNPMLTQAGANIDRPFQAHIDGANCLASNATPSPGLVNFGFPDLNRPALVFALGPNPAVASQHGNSAFTGTGRYLHIMITGSSSASQHFTGLATIVVNADIQSGTFALEDGSAAGSWRCSHPIPIIAH